MTQVDRIYTDNPVIPRLRLGQPDVRPETVAHHTARYRFAACYVRPGSLAVDMCCGTGYGTQVLKEAGAGQAIGIDLSEEAIDYAAGLYPDCEFVRDDIGSFLTDVRDGVEARPGTVTFFEAIEHIERAAGYEIMSHVQSALAPDGNFFMSTPRDIRADVNPDHITQWEYEELEDALRSRFDEVEMFGQDWTTGEFTAVNQRVASFFVARCAIPLASTARL